MVSSQIRQARLAAGLTQDEVTGRLAERGVTITKAGLSKYELGKSMPPASFLLTLADVLGVKPSYFLREPAARIEWLAFRKHSQLGVTRQEQIKSYAATVADRQFELYSLLYPDESPTFPEPRPARTAKDAEAAAAELRALWNLGDAPIESMTQVVEDHGGIVVTWDKDAGRFDGLSAWINDRFPLAVINTAVARDRSRYNLAHELGHMVMYTADLDDKEQERLAHRFAAALLVPPDVAKRELGAKRHQLDLRELGLLKLKYGLSIQAWIRRARDLGIIAATTYSRLCILVSTRGMRTSEPYALHGFERPTRLRQMTLHALAEGLITEEKALEICPECITPAQPTRATGQRYSARDLMKMPREQRDRILAEAAEAAEAEYRDNPALSEFEAFGEDDLYDEYPE
jgi:Zn-dependent peptidase ImmA (M78 family)/transcriptional regulator with XRE-family HTH domain